MRPHRFFTWRQFYLFTRCCSSRERCVANWIWGFSHIWKHASRNVNSAIDSWWRFQVIGPSCSNCFDWSIIVVLDYIYIYIVLFLFIIMNFVLLNVYVIVSYVNLPVPLVILTSYWYTSNWQSISTELLLPISTWAVNPQQP